MLLDDAVTASIHHMPVDVLWMMTTCHIEAAMCCAEMSCGVPGCALPPWCACSNGADALKKYQGDKDIVEAAMEAGQVLQQLQEKVSTTCSGMHKFTDPAHTTALSLHHSFSTLMQP